MPYSTIQDLPDSVREHLPSHAQEIYQAAFNHAWNEYKDADRRNSDESREEVSHKVAWSAVKKEYAKAKDGAWKRLESHTRK